MSPAVKATEPFWPLPSLRPVEWSCGGWRRVPERTRWVRHRPGRTLRATARQVAFAPSALGQGHCVVPGATVLSWLAQPVRANRDCKEKDAAWRQCCRPRTLCDGGEACERCLQLDTHVAPTLGTPSRGDAPPLAPAPPQAWPWQGWRKDGCFRLVSIIPGLVLALGTVGGLGSSAAGAGALVLHPRLLSITDGMSPATSSLPTTGGSALLVRTTRPRCCQPRGPAAPALPSLGTRALGTRHHPRGRAAMPLQRGTRWGRGVFHRVFHTLAPAVSPLCPQPRPSSQSPSPCFLPALTARFP